MARAYRTTLTPEQLSERARKAAAARHSLDTYVKTIVARAPELSPAQLDQLAGIFAESRAA